MKTFIELCQRADELLKKSNFQGAIAVFNDAIEADSDSPQKSEVPYYGKGLAFKRMNKPEQAIEAFKEVVKLKDSHIKAWCELGELYLKIENYKDAQKAFEHVLKYESDHVFCLLGLEKCRNKLRAQIFYGIVDLKLTKDNKVKMLELGEGIWSGMGPHVYHYPDEPILDKVSKIIGTRTSSPVFLDMSGDSSGALANKINSQLQLEPTADFDETLLSNFKAVYGERNRKKISSEVLAINDMISTQFVCEDKGVFADLMSEANLQEFLPRFKKYPKKYDANLAKKISAEIPGDILVVKTPDMSNADGVILVHKSKLDLLLKVLLIEDQSSIVFKRSIAEYCGIEKSNGRRSSVQDSFFSSFGGFQEKVAKISTWRNCSSAVFIVQEYCASKPVQSNEKLYDATMRVFYLLSSDRSGVSFDVVTAYWKLPKQPTKFISEDLAATRISFILGNPGNSKKVDAEDLKCVTDQLSLVMPQLFQKMRDFSYADYSKKLEKSLAKEGALILHAANAYGHCGYYPVARSLLEKATRLFPGNLKPSQEIGIAYNLEGKYTQAIKAFTDSLSIGPDSATYLRRAEAYENLERYDEALADLNWCIELNSHKSNVGQAELAKARVQEKMHAKILSPVFKV